MTSTNTSVGRQLLVAMVSNNEAEFVRILDAAYLHVWGSRANWDAEIDCVIDQIREAELALGLEYDLASRKMVRSEIMDRLAAKKEVLLAA